MESDEVGGSLTSQGIALVEFNVPLVTYRIDR